MEGFTKIFGFALFMMIIISFSATMFYPNDVTAQEQYDDYVDTNYLNKDAVLMFKDWINAQFEMSKRIIVNGFSQEEVESRYTGTLLLNEKVHGRLKLDYSYGIKNSGGWGYWQEKYLVFKVFQNGYAWWKDSPSLRERHWFGLWDSNMKEDIKNNEYNNYLKKYGYNLDENENLYEYEKSFIDYAIDFFGALGGGFTAIADILTLNFRPNDAPSDAMFNNVVAIFIYPLVAIVTIGLALFAAKFISAIGALVPG